MEKQNIFFVNAHPDDLIAGIGLSILLRESGRYRIHVVDFTDGEHGLDSQNVPPAECAAMRRLEEEKVCRELGAELYWLGQPDGSACATPEVCRKIADLFMQAPPRAIITQWLVDTHVDHVMTGAAVLQALRILTGTKSGQMKGAMPEVYFYDHVGNALAIHHQFYVPFDRGVMDRKMDLIRLYACQNGEGMALMEQTADRYYGYRVRGQYAEAYAQFMPPVPGKPNFFEELLQDNPLK